MNANDHIEGAWKRLRGKIKEQWGRLTDDELDEVEGKWDQLAGLIQQRYGRARDEVEAELRSFRDSYDTPVTR
jgi:uncharacterized protein YjbJ (UPF0337 family)